MSEKIPTILSKWRSVCPRFGGGRRQGSVTVEAAIALPLFFMAMMLIAAILNIQYVHRQVGMALENACRTMSAYIYPAEHVSDGVLPDGGGEVVSVAYAEVAVMNELGKYPLVNRLLWGIVDCRVSRVAEDGSTVDLVARYSIRLSLGPFRSGTLTYVQRAYMHGWVGYEEDTMHSDEGEWSMVYVTETGIVYHKDPGCTYLNPSIRQVSKDSLSELRSMDGSIYHACELCGDMGGACYITTYGDRYHSDPRCSGVKRTIQEVPLSQVEGTMGACSKCGR